MALDQLLQYLFSGLTHGSIYALVGVGFTIIYAVTSIINFAQGEFVMLGGMLSFFLFASMGVPLPIAVILAIIVAAVVGALLYLLAIRSAKQASVVNLIIITIGAAIFIRGIAAEIWGVDAVRPPTFTGNQAWAIGEAYIQPQAVWLIGITLVLTLLLHLFFNYTMMGKAQKACAINRSAAGMVGINAKFMALTAFVMAGAIGAIGGTVMAPHTSIAYGMGAMIGLKGFVAASIGGFKSPVAAVVGGLTLGVVEAMAIAINWGPFSSAYKDAIALVVLLAILLLRAGKLAAEERPS